jgi:hypothetical protein
LDIDLKTMSTTTTSTTTSTTNHPFLIGGENFNPKTDLPALKTQLQNELTTLQTTHPDLASDTKLIRFLSAADGNVDEAVKNFREHLTWRNEVNADGIRERISGKPFLLESAPHFHTMKEAGFPFACIQAGRSRMNDIVHLEMVGEGVTSDVLQKIGDEMLLEHYTGYFELRSIMLESGSKQDFLLKTLQIRDLSKFSLSLVAEREALSIVSKIIKTGASNYPESTRYALFAETPSLFATAWSVFQTIIPERTKKKVRFLATPSHRELLRYVPPVVCVVLQRMSQGECGDALAKTFPPPPLHTFETEVVAGSAQFVHVDLKQGKCESVSFLVTKGGEPYNLSDEEIELSWVDEAQRVGVIPEDVVVHLKNGTDTKAQSVISLPKGISEALVSLKLDNSSSWFQAESFKVVFVY